MPRGNLETIHPRTLVIAKLKHHINKYVHLIVKTIDLVIFIYV